MNDHDAVSPYLKKRIRSLKEAQEDQLATGGTRLAVLRAIEDSRARGEKPSLQFQRAVDALLALCPELPEAQAVDSVHRLIQDEEESKTL